MAHESLREMFDTYARMTVKQGQTFDAIGGQNVIMDISEFSRWAHEYGLVPKYLSLEKMKTIFREANVGDHADEFRHTFDFDEFVECVRNCVNEAMIACGDGALPAKIAHLRTLLAGGDADATRPGNAIATPSQMSANLMAAYDRDNASDGVRVPVSQLWSSVREVESHLQTEEQLRGALDRLAAQAKSEVSQLERQKAAAVAALEASEDQLLELEREANAQLDELQLARDDAKAEAAAAREEMEKMKADHEKKTKALEDINTQAIEAKEQAISQREEMARLLEAADEERDHAYGDARTMAKERDAIMRDHKLAEANWQKERSALDRQMQEAISELEKQMETERTEHQISLSKAQEKFEVDLKAVEKKSADLLKEAESIRRKQVADLEAELHEAKRAAEQADRDAKQKFRDAEAEWKNTNHQLAAELETQKGLTRNVEGELSRTQRTMEDVKTRLGNDIERLHSELQTEMERREASAAELAKLKEDFAGERLRLNSDIDAAQRRAQAAEMDIVSLKGEIDGLKTERASLTDKFNTARNECDRLYRELENSKQDVKNKEVEISSLQGTLEQARKDHELYVKTAERQQAALQADLQTEQSSHEATRQQLRELQSDLQTARDEIRRLTEQMQEDRRRYLAEKEAQFNETKRRIEAFKKEHQAVEEGLRTELKGTHALLDAARDEINSLKEQLAVSKSREENLQQVRAALDEKTLQQQRELEKKAIRISELEDQINRLQQQIRSLEQAAEDMEERHNKELEFLRAEMAAKVRAAEEAAKSTNAALTAELSRCKEEAALLRADLQAANVTIEELRDANNKLRGQLSAEESAHTRTQNDMDALKRELAETQLKLQKSQVIVDEKVAQIRKLEERTLQLEADLRMAVLSREQLEAELERCLGEERRLNGALAEEKAHCQTVQQRKELVDKKLGQTEAVVDTLRVELDSLHMTNDQLAKEARKEIVNLKEAMNKMKDDYDTEIRRLQEKLAQLQADRDQMESAYQFAKDELMVIKATLAEMEEGKARTQYIVEDAGNPTLVNRMNSEWTRVDGGLEYGDGGNDEYSPKRKAFAREFRRTHTSPPPEPVMDPAMAERQGRLGHSPWRY